MKSQAALNEIVKFTFSLLARVREETSAIANTEDSSAVGKKGLCRETRASFSLQIFDVAFQWSCLHPK